MTFTGRGSGFTSHGKEGVFLLAETLGGDPDVVGRGLGHLRIGGSVWRRSRVDDVTAHHRSNVVPDRLVALTGRVGLADVGTDAQGFQLARWMHTGCGERIEEPPAAPV